MCVQVRGLLARWGFAHLIAVNLSQWAYIVILEAYENILHDSVGSHDNANDGHDDGNYGNDHGDGAGDVTHPPSGHGNDHGDDNGLLSNITELINDTITGVTENISIGDGHHEIHKSKDSWSDRYVAYEK